MKNYNYLFKYIIVGSTSVGKSCLLLQYVEQKFRGVHQVTMGVEFGTHVVNINENLIKLHIWDTVLVLYMRGWLRVFFINDQSLLQKVLNNCSSSIGCILVFDLTDRKTFDALKRWHNEVMNCSGNDIQIIVVGNKNDLDDRREVFTDEGMEMAAQFNGLYIETSALTGQNVNAAFDRLTIKILENIRQGKIDISDEIYGIKVGDFEKRRHSEIQQTQRKLSVQISYPIQQKQCC